MGGRQGSPGETYRKTCSDASSRKRDSDWDMRFVQEASPLRPHLLIGVQASRLARPLLNIGPVPNESCLESCHRFWEVRMAPAPIMDNLKPSDAKTLGDLG
jgi:hypothetical protein